MSSRDPVSGTTSDVNSVIFMKRKNKLPWTDRSPLWMDEWASTTAHGTLYSRYDANEVVERKLWVVWLDRGADTTLVFLHGLGGRAEQFREVMDEFKQHTSYNILAPDLLGHGHSDKPHGAEYYESVCHIEDILGLLHTFVPKDGKYILIGHSMGSMLTMFTTHLTLRCTTGANLDRLQGHADEPPVVVDDQPTSSYPCPNPDIPVADPPLAIVLIGTSASAPAKPALFHCWDWFLQLIRPIISKASAQRIFHPNTSQELVQAEKLVTNNNPFHVISPSVLQMLWPDTAVQQQLGDTPCLVLQGESDGIMSVQTAAKLHTTIPGSKFEVVMGTSHNLMIEEPLQIANILRSFCEQVTNT